MVARGVVTHIASGKITALKHEAWNDPMKTGSFIAVTFFGCAERAKIRGCSWYDVIIELENYLRWWTYPKD